MLLDSVSNMCYFLLHVPEIKLFLLFLSGETEIKKNPKWVEEGTNGQIAKYKQQSYD